MKIKKGTIPEDGIPYEFYQCNLCGEEILNMKQLQALAQTYRKLRKAKEVSFAQWGNSIAIRIPAEIAQEYHITPGKKGIMTKNKEGIQIIPA